MDAPTQLDALRVKVLDAERVADDDRDTMVMRPLAGRWVAVLYSILETETQIFERMVERSELAALGGEQTAFAAAIANDRATAPEAVDIMRVSDGCFLYFFHSPEDPFLSGRVLDLAGLLESLPELPDEARARADLSRGAIVGVPMETLLCVFFVATGDVEQGAFSVAHNVLTNYDEDDDEAVAPELCWVHDGKFEPIEFAVEGLPDDLRLPPGLVD